MDIVGYITVYHMFVAHMTGTTVKLGTKLAIAAWPDAAKSATVLLSFVLGAIAGRAVIEAGNRRKLRTVASVTLLAEAALILTFLLLHAFLPELWQRPEPPLQIVCLSLALLAAAMGLQTATLTRIGPLTIHTTFVTGMLNKLAQAISEWSFWFHDEWRKGARFFQIWRQSKRNSAFQNAVLMSAIWFSYLVGSVAGTWMSSRWSARALCLPIAALVLAALVDQLHPLSIEEEKEEI